MDTGEGRFIQGEYNDLIAMRNKFENPGGIFKVGETIEIRGSLFKISKIIRNGLKLELLPKATNR